MNLVVGATGLLGKEICQLLASQGKPVRAMARQTSDQTKVNDLEHLVAEVIRGDLKDRSSLSAVCRGVKTVISTASSTLSRQEGDTIQSVDRDGQLALVDAAKAAGVEHFILVSFPHIDVEFPLQDAKRLVEQHLKESGLAYTILQPTCFMEIWLSPVVGFDSARARAQIYGAGRAPTSWISYKDVARFATACVDNPEAQNAVIELGGPEALSHLDVVRIFEDVTGRKFDLSHLTEEQLWAQKESAADSLQESFAGLMLSCAHGQPIDMRETLQRFPVQLTSVRDYARQGPRDVKS